MVAVADNELIVTPNFPFNLMFLPDIYDLDHRAPFAAIVSVRKVWALMGSDVLVAFDIPKGRLRTLRLNVLRPEALIAALRGWMSAALKPKPNWTKSSGLSPEVLAMQTFNIHEAKTQLSRLVDQAAKGESFIIAKAGKPLVKVMALTSPEGAEVKRIGFLRGQISVPADFDDMGRDEIEAMFGGAS